MKKGRVRDAAFYDAEWLAPQSKPNQTIQTIWAAGANLALEKKIPYVVDIGCGAGRFATVLHDKHPNLIRYWGVDFSEKALDLARKKVVDCRFAFISKDLTILSDNIVSPPPPPERSMYCIFEVLEHLEDDLKVVRMIPKDAHVVISVPTYWASDHVRVFSEVELTRRYGDLIRVEMIVVVPGQAGRHLVCVGRKK